MPIVAPEFAGNKNVYDAGSANPATRVNKAKTMAGAAPWACQQSRVQPAGGVMTPPVVWFTVTNA